MDDGTYWPQDWESIDHDQMMKNLDEINDWMSDYIQKHNLYGNHSSCN